MDTQTSHKRSSDNTAFTPEVNLYDEWLIIPKSYQCLSGRPPEFTMLLQKPLGSPSDVVFEVRGDLDRYKGYVVEFHTVAHTETTQEQAIRKDLIARVKWRQISEPKSGVAVFQFPLIEAPKLGFLQEDDHNTLDSFVRTCRFGRTVIEAREERKTVEMVSLIHPIKLKLRNETNERKMYLRSTDTKWHGLSARKRVLYGFVDWDIESADTDENESDYTPVVHKHPDFTMVYEEQRNISGRIRIRREAFENHLDHLVIFVLFLDLLDWEKGDLKVKLDKSHEE